MEWEQYCYNSSRIQLLDSERKNIKNGGHHGLPTAVRLSAAFDDRGRVHRLAHGRCPNRVPGRDAGRSPALHALVRREELRCYWYSGACASCPHGPALRRRRSPPTAATAGPARPSPRPPRPAVAGRPWAGGGRSAGGRRCGSRPRPRRGRACSPGSSSAPPAARSRGCTRGGAAPAGCACSPGRAPGSWREIARVSASGDAGQGGTRGRTGRRCG